MNKYRTVGKKIKVILKKNQSFLKNTKSTKKLFFDGWMGKPINQLTENQQGEEKFVETIQF